MKIIPRERLRPGERRQRTTYDINGRVLIPGTRERNRIALEGKQADRRIPPSGSKATPAPGGPGMAPLKGARTAQEKDTSHRQSPGNSSDDEGLKARGGEKKPKAETTETGSMMEGSQRKGKLFPGARRPQTTLATQAKR